MVTYYWYRFADQPAMLNADLTPEEREIVQKRVEKLHRAWTKDRNYLAPPDVGTLAESGPGFDSDAAARPGSRLCPHRHATGIGWRGG